MLQFRHDLRDHQSSEFEVLMAKLEESLEDFFPPFEEIFRAFVG